MAATAAVQGCDEAQVPGAKIVTSIQQGISERAFQLEACGSDWPDQWGETPWADWDDAWAQMASP